jgi:5-methylcytosine-specific restriction endonuclease McrA
VDTTYTDYLKSAEWMLKREQTLKHWDYRCSLCFGDGNLEVHHRTYIRLGQELPTDLIVLCDNCHERHHQIFGLNEKLFAFWQNVYKELDIKPEYY